MKTSSLLQVQKAAATLLGKESWEPCAQSDDRAWKRRVNAFLQLKMAAESGDKLARIAVEEAMSTDDFPNVLGDTLNREVRQRYMAFPKVWEPVCARRPANDYRTLRSFAPNQLNGLLTATGEFGGNTPMDNKADRAATTYALEDYAKRTAVSKRALMNDDVGEFAGIPQDFADAAINTEGYQFTSQIVNSSGPTGVTGLTSNPVFSVVGLKAAMTEIMKATDPTSGMPIMMEAPILMVGPGLAVDAREVIRATSVELTPQLGATARAVMTENWITSFISNVIVNPWIPYIQSSNEDTTWLLFASPRPGAAAVEAAFLRGMEEPRVYVRTPNQQRVGGGPAPITDGQFEAPIIEYKVEHTFAFKLVASNLVYGSNGSGS